MYFDNGAVAGGVLSRAGCAACILFFFLNGTTRYPETGGKLVIFFLVNRLYKNTHLCNYDSNVRVRGVTVRRRGGIK